MQRLKEPSQHESRQSSKTFECQKQTTWPRPYGHHAQASTFFFNMSRIHAQHATLDKHQVSEASVLILPLLLSYKSQAHYLLLGKSTLNNGDEHTHYAESNYRGNSCGDWDTQRSSSQVITRSRGKKVLQQHVDQEVIWLTVKHALLGELNIVHRRQTAAIQLSRLQNAATSRLNASKVNKYTSLNQHFTCDVKRDHQSSSCTNTTVVNPVRVPLVCIMHLTGK